ncbi:PAS domain-containing protein [Ideonella sp. YS5]|uniref:hybrid sensor histidine kinase/response regulator n=1 Tax=Ideonella sp. YS5 TaxID=3453714 RepID=UPI003EEA32C8
MPSAPPPQDPSFDLDQLHLALDMSEVSIWRMDIATERVHANAAGFRVLGHEPRTQGWTVAEMMQLIHPDDREAVVASAHQARVEKRPVELLVRFRHQDGTWRRMLTRRVPIRDAAGQLLAFFGMAIDVSERLRAEERLRDANERIALIARSTGIGTWEWDLPEGRSRWDDQMFRLRGLTPRATAPALDEMTQYVHPDDRERVNRQIRQAAAGGEAAQYEFRVCCPDGQVRWLASRSLPVVDDQGRIVRRLGVNWDITASREAEQERQAAALAQRESEAKSELLARMSHELRTPLNAILGFSELLLAHGESMDAAARQARLEHIQSAGRHLLALINDVLELARPGAETAHPLGPVALERLLGETLPLVEGAAAECGVSVRREPCPAGLAAWGDPLWLKQVLLNLLTNAVKYNRPGGWVDLSARVISSTRLCITVRDSGHGMTAEALARAFEPFQQAAERQPGVPGVGIGLAVVKTLMQRMGGAVTARSTPGQGSEFELWLDRPAAPARATAAPVPSPGEKPPATNGHAPLLLYIEDNPVNVMIVQELAHRRPGLRFHSAPDGDSGLRLAAELAPSLILLDMQLPDLHGLTVFERLRQDPRTLHIPCIALSANAMPEDIRQAMNCGFADYWTKPLDFTLFNQVMDGLIRRQHPPPATAD